MKILVTGGTARVGRALVVRLAQTRWVRGLGAVVHAAAPLLAEPGLRLPGQAPGCT
jgi:uncharacterized protein YbjT (DUF2867 family)